jgi:hypothetical protein
MSDEPKRPTARRPFVPLTVLAFAAAIGAYQGTHYATATVVDNDLRFCCGTRTHQIGTQRVPEWIDALFSVAYVIDDLTGIHPERWH